MEYYTSQYFPVFAPWGCASSSLSMLMKYDHTFNKVPGKTARAKLTYMQNHLPRNKAKGGQDGSPYTGLGFTRVILAPRLTKYAHQLGDKKIRNISGISLNNVKKLVLGGHPVLYYGYSSYDANGYRNHCKAIFGYSKKSNKFLVHDPLYQVNKFYRGGGGRNAYDLGPISWVKASHINREFAYRGGNNALTTD
ncbi:C39 family peptidase [Lactobacillus kefiranofaciens]|uniref:C39 family peptidase n=1 Tax=Lactobacillus kefiranofaciens TaxID=267818 RepID=UPI002468D283|nr:C39 family peptidase [Lactobacillus kefiranofaciens]MDH5100595.1 C39 family peptidase [Lactobacillus kefiranofaciens]